MPQETISLLPVDHVKITVIMDNSIDLLMTSTDIAKRIRLGPVVATSDIRAKMRKETAHEKLSCHLLDMEMTLIRNG
jgi:hypothetical protein